MYSRNYTADDTPLRLPENYDGTAFPCPDAAPEPPQDENEIDTHEPEAPPTVPASNIFSGLSRMPILSGIFGEGSALGNISLKIPKIGTEEILIIAAAAYLFFSKDGDRECAIILLLTLLIS